MKYNIKNINIKEIDHLKEMAKKDGILFPKKNFVLLGAYLKDTLVGFGGFVLKKDSAIIKCDYVIKEYRKQGVASQLHKIRLGVMKVMGLKYVEANATPMALKMHLNSGARIVNKYKNGITKVSYENI